MHEPAKSRQNASEAEFDTGVMPWMWLPLYRCQNQAAWPYLVHRIPSAPSVIRADGPGWTGRAGPDGPMGHLARGFILPWTGTAPSHKRTLFWLVRHFLPPDKLFLYNDLISKSRLARALPIR